ncbi:hypothetical protein K501DRAFT_329154 [Backusella circina FSU 941]|nr:hypothetical protein K501DRAFT_329154 [Backusella circina FSU 941]
MTDNKSELCLLGIDPLLNVDVKLFIKDIYSLATNDSLKGFFRLYQHTIQNAEVCGCVVAIEMKGVTAIYTVDDGTGTIECTFEPDSPLQADPIGLGDCVRVAGKINDHREMRELKAHALALMGPNDELMHNVQVLCLRKEYQKPFEIPLEFKSISKDIEKQLNKEEIELGMVISDTQEMKTDKASFCDALLNFLKLRYPNQSVFSATSPIADEHLKVLAKEAMMNSEFNSDPSIKQLSHFFFHNIKLLETNGHIVQTDQKGQLYKVVDEERLKDSVLRIIQEMLDSKTNYIGNIYKHIGGVFEDYIVARIQIEEQTPFSSDKIVQLLKEMVMESVIWECAAGEYQII